jgi:hypothetical protein
MAWRKWLVRGLVFSVAGAAISLALTYEAWTNPSAVRREVLDKLTQQFIGATVSLDSARLRLLGGIVVHDLRMARREDLDHTDFLYVPSAVIYHDKEHLLDGTLAIRKIELEKPHLRIVRDRNGKLNLSGLLAPPDLKERVPTIAIHQGTITIEDHSLASTGTLLELKDVNLTIVNDPLSTLVIEGAGQSDEVGLVRIQARLHRPTDAASASLELPEIPVGPALVQRLASVCPDTAAHLRQLQGTGKIEATFVHRPGAVQPWTYDLRCYLTGGRCYHASLPETLEQIEASLHCVNGHVPKASLQARAGPAKVQVDLWDLQWPKRAPERVEDVVGKLEASVEHLVVTPKCYEHLPKACQDIRRLYSPLGPVSLKYTFDREGKDHWRKHWIVRPEGMTAEFEHFRYPIEAIAGTVDVDLRSDGDNLVTVDLTGRGPRQPVTIKGEVRGDQASEVDLTVVAADVPVDDKLMRALPKKSRELARTFLPPESRELGAEAQPLGLTQPAGLADIKVFIRRARGQSEFANRYVAAFHDTKVRWDVFPLLWEKVSGVLDIQPDHWECRDFHGNHKGGELWVKGQSYRVPVVAPGGDLAEKKPSQSECVQVSIRGQNVLLDREFEAALSPPGFPGRAALRNAWATLALRGRLSFEANVIDRPDRPQDIDVGVELRGCAMQPEFFRYEMTNVCAGVRYRNGRVDVSNVSAEHRGCRLRMKDATIVLKSAGGFQAWFKGIHGKDLLPNEEFLRALHPALRKGLEPLQLRKPLDVQLTYLIFDAPATANQPLKIWWDGGASLRKQVFQAGLEIAGVDGEIWCSGHHNGQQFEGVTGSALLERADILGQPFRNLQGRIEIHRNFPDVLRLYNLKADLFGGFVGGEARFDFGSTLRYRVKLDALGVQLEQFGKHNNLGKDAQLQGRAGAHLYLEGEGTDLSGLKGDGRVEVPNGKLYRLPLLLDLLKAFGLRLPDRTAFEQARMIFAIAGPQMRIYSLDLIGNAISLRGQGTLGLDGNNLNLDFSADWGRMPQMLPSAVSDLSQAISDRLFKIKMRGKIAAPRFDKEFIPGVVDPIKKVFRGS